MSNHIIISGAGLVGSLLGIYLSKKGYKVEIYEKRGDLRGLTTGGGRSINLALSDRGLRALDKVGLKEKVLDEVIPMKGRMIHDEQEHQELQPYGDEGQVINSISRLGLNVLLLNEAEANGAKIYFNHRCDEVDLKNNEVSFTDLSGKSTRLSGEVIIGADGAFSAIRAEMQKSDRFNYQQRYLEHGYKELSIPPVDGNFAMDPNALHIWPRRSYMLIALPNLDKTFTCTLFFPFDGDPSFEMLKSDSDIESFFSKVFPDARRLMPDLIGEYRKNPTSSLVTVRCEPWVKGRFLLIGDAAHAIVPFYGQGMNSGFEDCMVLIDMLEANGANWTKTLESFSKERKQDGDAIADLALRNFIEMRDSVVDENFVERKRLEKQLHERYGDAWLPLYSMVTFSDLRYSEALKRGKIQDRLMEELMADDCEKFDFELALSEYQKRLSQ